MKNDKVFFSAVMERTSSMLLGNSKIDKSGYYFKDVRTRGGELLCKYIIPRLEIEDQERLVNYGTGDYVAFLADVELKSLELTER